MSFDAKLKSARGAGECIVTKYEDGVPVSTETVPSPTAEESKLKFAKRGPKPGSKFVQTFGKGLKGYNPNDDSGG